MSVGQLGRFEEAVMNCKGDGVRMWPEKPDLLLVSPSGCVIADIRVLRGVRLADRDARHPMSVRLLIC